jgi:hypothetical protein
MAALFDQNATGGGRQRRARRFVICSESGSKRFNSVHADNTTLSLNVLTEGAGNVVQYMSLILFLYSPYTPYKERA